MPTAGNEVETNVVKGACPAQYVCVVRSCRHVMSWYL